MEKLRLFVNQKGALLLMLLLSFYGNSVAQYSGISNNWILGYGNQWGSPYGEMNIDFISGQPVINNLIIPMDFRHTHANISDSAGNLLFYTNGVYIADATHDTMMNGSGINPGAYSNFVPDGHLIPQSALILKKPGWNSLYYLFHNTCSSYGVINGCRSYELYLTIIDMSLNGGLGEVTLKNFPIIIDTLNVGKITAAKHANGRDWWVVCHRVNSDKYYKLLVTPYGLPTVSTQNFGSIRFWDAGQAKFSHDGTKFAYYFYNNGLDIYDFDRCTGDFSNYLYDTLPIIQGNVGCEFSPNSQFLYVSNILKIYQYDMLAANVIASRTEVAVWDTFYSPSPPLSTLLCIPQLAPDGKIYITTGNSTFHMHTIDDPDLQGLSCNVNQHSLQLPHYYFNTLPNHPNYFLGKIPGSPCDTITGVGLEEPPDITVSVYPNPSNGNFTLSFPVQSTSGEVEIYDVNGKLVHKDYVAPWSQFKKMELLYLKKGIYFCKIKWPSFAKASEGKESSVKIIVE